jgi:hypothetical protein
MKHIRKFNEGFFSKKEDQSNDISPKGMMSSTGRPSEQDIKKGKIDIDKLSKKIEARIDSSFIQEISDRLYGPDSEEYIKALTELNKSFKPRAGRFGHQFDISEQ